MLDVTKNAPNKASVTFPVVGVGASAGGLEAFTQLLERLPPDTGLAFVLIQHLDPDHPSMLSEVLARATSMPVRQAEQGMRVEPNHVYVIAPNTDVAIHDGELVASPRRSEGPKSHLPVDFFLRSLAKELGNRAIGIVLSGTASDGTDGLRAIRAEDGITFVQDPRSAKFPGMPQSAIQADVVDYCMDIPQLADELVRLSRHPYVQPSSEQNVVETDADVRKEIFARVRSAVGVDFSEFKSSSVGRRLARRMALRGATELRGYLELLKTDPDEVRALYEDMLVHVTSFFRDPEVFESLRANAFPEIRKHKPAGGPPIRMWVSGCSTGEEVYSLAIAWMEFSGEAPGAHPLQIFGSDISELAIQRARAGVYSENTMRDVNDERRKRYFTKTEVGYRINKSVRDLCVFVRHDLVRDPPFSRLDLVSCRNVLIYFDIPLQKRVFPTLHYSLNQPGFLVLGRSENIGGFSSLFSVVDKANRIFMRTSVPSRLRFAPRSEVDPKAAPPQSRARGSSSDRGAAFARHLDRMLLGRYCPPGVLINEGLDVLLYRGQTGAFLQAAPGQPQNNLIGMARGGLIAPLRDAIAEAKRERVIVTRQNVEVDQDGAAPKVCDVVVLPWSGLPESSEPLFIVLFEEPKLGTLAQPVSPRLPDVVPSGTEPRRISRLEHELSATKEYLNTLIEEHGRTSEELGVSNEELVSGNEELQSMNEELETAKEELQSINEELTTLNDELQSRNQETTQANSDLLNFALAVDTPILTLDMQRRIRRFTPNAREILNVLPSDIGRSIDDIKLNIVAPDLGQRITDAIASEKVNETEIQDRRGHWYRMQVRPYTTTERRVDGVIISLVDIHALKLLVSDAQEARADAERANSAKDIFLATLSHELRTPLSSMLLNAQRLRSGLVSDSAGTKHIGEAIEHATFMQVQLIDDLLDVSRIIAGKLTLDYRRIDLNGVVQASLDSLSPRITEKGLALHTSLEPALGAIWADRMRVQQVITNLLVNAIKFTSRDGKVTIVVDRVGDFARLRVTDTGIGIDPSFLPHVFASFSQSDSSITRTYGGLGLGLSLVRHLVELHGGNASAESPGVGQGATFSVTFPLAQASDRATARLEGTAASEDAAAVHALDRPDRTQHYDALKDVRVLFIDDDLQTREAVLEVLRFTGAHVELAASAAEGMALAETFKPQVIVCDIAMPGEDGYTFIRKLRAREAATQVAPVPALALTALSSDDDRKRAIEAGFQMHLAKPIDIDRLRAGVLELSEMSKNS